MPPSARGSPKPSARGSPKASMRSGDGVARADGVSFRLPLTVDGRPAGVLSGKLRADIQLEHNLEKTYLYGLFQLTGAQRGVTRRDSTSTAGGILPHVTSKAHTEGRGHSSVMGRTITEHGNRLKHKLVHSSEGYPSLARGALRVVENNARSLLGFKNRNDDYPRDRGNKEIRV
uniref:Uncharacterized protein n=1 Tax=Prymnesium polylepis TaxID=72548 RepID=A0A7S4HFK3_9EUKA|mmetsp:Transcript_15645/g.39729  ORF Transcript_15645/g.39729 Transcript_15645/m.39729 type:complete len:174 (+) Transcript_15645:1-522(+)